LEALPACDARRYPRLLPTLLQLSKPKRCLMVIQLVQRLNILVLLRLLLALPPCLGATPHLAPATRAPTAQVPCTTLLPVVAEMLGVLMVTILLTTLDITDTTRLLTATECLLTLPCRCRPPSFNKADGAISEAAVEPFSSIIQSWPSCTSCQPPYRDPFPPSLPLKPESLLFPNQRKPSSSRLASCPLKVLVCLCRFLFSLSTFRSSTCCVIVPRSYLPTFLGLFLSSLPLIVTHRFLLTHLGVSTEGSRSRSLSFPICLAKNNKT
jgi:hypothetical protein